MLIQKMCAWLIASLMLSSCVSVPSANRNMASMRAPIKSWTLEQAMAETSNHTSVSYMPGHGTQIEYNAPDGSSYLWYPGNRRVVEGKWKVETKDYGTAMCYQYGTNTYNPMTKQIGGKWECRNYQQGDFFTVDTREGDVFGIGESGQIPYVLTREEVRPYISNSLPLPRPYLTEGKSPIDHLLANLSARKGG